ncbi:hypothetical protein AVEN_109728-1 [Araneus ventricosus]|uniref:Uncharacterized protein n=1 Tax=Araneus ventricosus TaxID=182803 RepID=A0A4Y2SYV8_ARAVE|nr:hypothetical protein AVEN_109728-1 [Araneus ventricosus]
MLTAARYLQLLLDVISDFVENLTLFQLRKSMVPTRRCACAQNIISEAVPGGGIRGTNNRNSILPPSFVNKVVKIVKDETIVRSNLKSVSDVYSCIEEYGRTLNKIRLSNQSPPKLQWCSARVQNANIPPGGFAFAHPI